MHFVFILIFRLFKQLDFFLLFHFTPPLWWIFLFSSFSLLSKDITAVLHICLGYTIYILHNSHTHFLMVAYIIAIVWCVRVMFFPFFFICLLSPCVFLLSLFYSSFNLCDRGKFRLNDIECIFINKWILIAEYSDVVDEQDSLYIYDVSIIFLFFFSGFFFLFFNIAIAVTNSWFVCLLVFLCLFESMCVFFFCL